MAQTEIQKPDPVLDGLQALLEEFKSHKERLELRRNQLRIELADGRLTEAELGKVTVEIFGEIADTALSFQEDVTRLVFTGFAEAGDDEEDDEVDEEIDDVDSLLLPGDAAVLLGIVTDHHAMVTEILRSWKDVTIPDAERARIEAMQKQAEIGRRLIEDITLDDGDAPAEADDEGDDDDDEGDDADEADAPAN